MIRRLGVIGDVHGEHHRLDTALEWFAGEQVDALVCTGDIADGRGCINRCCALLQEGRVATVAGNHDRWLLDDRIRHVDNAHSIEELSEGNEAFLRGLPRTRTLDTGAGPLLLCHGINNNDLGKVWPGTPRSKVRRSAELDELLQAGSHRFLINGHMHFRVLIDFTGLSLLNAGTLKGDFAGVMIVDFLEATVQGYGFTDNNRLEHTVEHPLVANAARRIWQDTEEFDGTWEPVALHG